MNHPWAFAAAFLVLAVYYRVLFLRYQKSARKLAGEVVQLTQEKYAARVPTHMPLTSTPPKAQTPPKRYSGPQLRRMAEQVNNAEWDGLQERPNSEILQEQANG